LMTLPTRTTGSATASAMIKARLRRRGLGRDPMSGRGGTWLTPYSSDASDEDWSQGVSAGISFVPGRMSEVITDR
jgi:hypothetical protein